jgi:hypothetical protein
LQPANAGGGDAFVTKINPTGSALVYSTYLGGGAADVGASIAADASGNAYVAGSTASTNFPTKNPFQPTNHGGNPFSDAFVAKINSSGSAFVYSTYLGGSNSDVGNGVAVDSTGNAYVIGSTTSTDFPTANPLQPANGGGSDMFVTKFNPTGSALVYSTYLGSNLNDYGNGIALDSLSNTYVIGTVGSDVSLTKINPTGSAFVFSGGGFGETVNGVAVDSSGSAFVIGTNRVNSKNFPQYRVFVQRFAPSGAGLGYTTHFSGGSFSQVFGHGIATDGLGNAYVTGATKSGFPTKNPLQPANGGGFDAFVAKINMRLATTTTLTSSPNPSAKGEPVTFTAVVASTLTSTPPPDGETILFVEGKKVLGTGSLTSGSASFTTSALPTGTHGIKAAYAGDSIFETSKSTTVKQVVK